MNFAAVFLILGATGSASLSRETNDTIAGILAQCASGAFHDFRAKDGDRRLSSTARSAAIDVYETMQLTIDGRPREGLPAWASAGWRVGGYVADCRSDGSVCLAYRLRVGRYTVATSTSIVDGRVGKTIDAWWVEYVEKPMLFKCRPARYWSVPVHASIRIAAAERDGKTLLVGTATGFADTSDFYLFRCAAERQAAAELKASLPQVLATIDREGRAFYAGGREIAPALDRIGAGIRAIKIIRR